MATIETSAFRKGLKILHNGVPYSVVDFQHVKPGKGNAFTRTKIRNLQTGAVLEVTYRSGQVLEDPEVEERTMSFLYQDGGVFHLMDAKTFDQVEIQGDFMGQTKDFLLPDMQCDVVFWKGRPISIQIPQHVELRVAHCEPGVRGDTATNVTKPATLETGAVVDVPIFINVGDKLKIETDTGRYIERTAIGGGS